jgi:hypothetical protein
MIKKIPADTPIMVCTEKWPTKTAKSIHTTIATTDTVMEPIAMTTIFVGLFFMRLFLLSIKKDVFPGSSFDWQKDKFYPPKTTSQISPAVNEQKVL